MLDVHRAAFGRPTIHSVAFDVVHDMRRQQYGFQAQLAGDVVVQRARVRRLQGVVVVHNRDPGRRGQQQARVAHGACAVVADARITRLCHDAHLAGDSRLLAQQGLKSPPLFLEHVHLFHVIACPTSRAAAENGPACALDDVVNDDGDGGEAAHDVERGEEGALLAGAQGGAGGSIRRAGKPESASARGASNAGSDSIRCPPHVAQRVWMDSGVSRWRSLRHMALSRGRVRVEHFERGSALGPQPVKYD